MREGLRIVATLAFLAWAYSVIAIIHLPNASTPDPDPYIGRSRH